MVRSIGPLSNLLQSLVHSMRSFKTTTKNCAYCTLSSKLATLESSEVMGISENISAPSLYKLFSSSHSGPQFSLLEKSLNHYTAHVKQIPPIQLNSYLLCLVLPICFCQPHLHAIVIYNIRFLSPNMATVTSHVL